MISLSQGSSRVYSPNARKMWHLKSGMRFSHCHACLCRLNILQKEKLLQPPSQPSACTAVGRFLRISAFKRSQETNSAKEVRRKFIEYFTSTHNHRFVPSSSVLPPEGSGLLFTNAGMNQFKDIIQGTVDPRLPQSDYKRVVNSQKCIRAGGKHNDLEDVGKDTYHHTFFEMLGNWSFGDYFKFEACSMAWDLLTNVYRLPKEKLYVTYFKGDGDMGLPPDEETRYIWLSLGVPAHRVLPFGMKDNFWEMGKVGPCGPCSEIHFNRGNVEEASELVNRDHPDMLEVWNLVFMEQLRESTGLLKQLPKKHVDTGLGLERLVAILQGKTSNYDTDLFQPLMEAIQQYTGARSYSGLLGPSDRDLVDTSYRVIADHVRMLSVAIADGGQPDYYKRGYIIKRVIRRAVRFATEKLESPPGLLSYLVPVVIDLLGETYPELQRTPDRTCYIIDKEEKQFLKTLKKGEKFLLKTFGKLGPDNVLPGDLAWKMYDGFGFPIDLTTMIAEEHGVKIDMEGYEETRKKTREVTSQSGIKNMEVTSLFALKNDEIASLQKAGVATTKDDHKYNYSSLSSEKYDFPILRANILAIKSKYNGMVHDASMGEECAVILDCTNFYAEQGGQVGDEGVFLSIGGKEVIFNVTHTQACGGYVLHVGEVDKPLEVGMEVELTLDENRRLAIMKNHTATHILNFALREIMPEAEQRGSNVSHDKLRFDFNATRPLSGEEVVRLTSMCNDIIQSDQTVFQQRIPLSIAQAIPGVRAMFQEAGHDPAFIISIGHSQQKSATNFQDVDGKIGSVEFCGGTHVTNSRHIGQMVIASQKLASGGIRRLTIITGETAELAQQNANSLKEQVIIYNKQVDECLRNSDCDDQSLISLQRDIYSLETELDNVPFDMILKENLKTEITGLREKLKKHEKKRKKVTIATIIEELASQPNFLKHSRIIKVLPDGLEPRDLRRIGTQCQQKKMKSSLLLLSRKGSKVFGHCISSKEMVRDGFSAIEWAREATKLLGGNCNGDEYLATITGRSEQNLEDIIDFQV